MDSKQKLLSYVNKRTTHMTKDADTFLWMRMHNPREFVDGRLGGGNLLIALGLFAAMSYLAKIHHILKGGEFFSEAAKANEIHKALAAEHRKLLRTRRDGEINETDVFVTLVKAVPAIKNLGLKEATSDLRMET